MNEPLHFKTRSEFRAWLTANGHSHKGSWLLFSKTDRITTLKASEALEEALCFGWIDGVIKRIDDDTYVKYFTARKKNSHWSEKNKALVATLEQSGLMTEFGRHKIKEAKENGQWQAVKKNTVITDEQVTDLVTLIKTNSLAYDNFQKMSPSVQRTYTRAYLDAKTENGRLKRLAWLISRLEKNLKPM